MPWPRLGMASTSSWNGDGYCCGPQAINDTVDDVGFVRQVIMNVIGGLKGPVTVDTTRIYMTGGSMGCMLSHRFLTKHSNLIAAMSCTSHVIANNTVPAASAVTATPVLVIQGYVDEDTAYYGRRGEPKTAVDVQGVPWGLGYPYYQTS